MLDSYDRKNFPFFGRPEVGIEFDVERVRTELAAMEDINGWNDMVDGGKQVKDLIEGRERLTNAFRSEDRSYTHYKQIIITEYKGDGDEHDESNYGKPREEMKAVAPHLFERLDEIDRDYQITRVRFSKMRPGFEIDPHIDYNTTYGFRYHLGIYTNSDCGIAFRRNPKQPWVHESVPCDGRLWFVNQGFEHKAWNHGDSERTMLVIGTKHPIGKFNE